MPELEDPTTRAVNMVQIGQALTSTKPDPPIRALFVYSSNPAAIAPNQNLVCQGLAREDLFTVVHEQFLTDTAAYADYVLPATTQLEQLDLMWSWGHTYLSLNQPAIAPMGEAVSNTELFRRLAAQLGLEDAYLYTSDEERIRAVLHTDSPFLDGITYERLQRKGWAPLNIPPDWSRFAEGHFATPSGKCEFYAESAVASGMDPLPAFTPPREIADSDWVRVFSDRGEVTVRARVGDLVRPGVVAMPSGWWASLSPGGADANALTSDGLSDLGGGGDFHDTLVEVECRAATNESSQYYLHRT
jgi:anaerobic selenocysteine-containing dehydrogenase